MRLADWQRCFQSITTPGALLAQIPKLGIVLVLVLDLLGFCAEKRAIFLAIILFR
jgi:hypothetical protein